jgi:hypothetical protein
VRRFAFRSFRYLPDMLDAFRGFGTRLICFGASNTLSSLGVPYCSYPPIWTGPEQYDWEPLDQQVSDILTRVPDAELMVMVDLNTPDWWVRLHGQHGRHRDTFYDLGATIASEKWRDDTLAYQHALLEQMELHYANHVVAYMLQCGCTTEWQDHSMGQESPSRLAAWRRWRVGRGHPDPLDIPMRSVREHLEHPPFRDPVEDGLAIDYWRFGHALVADTILLFARAAQEVLQHRVPVGVFYGYVLEHGPGRLLYEGHLAYERVFRSPDIDFIMAPGTYQERRIGDASGVMTCVDSLKLHGKSYIHEIDHRTHTARSVTLLGRAIPGHADGFADTAESIAGLRREFCLALCKGLGMWWFDMFGSWYDDPDVLAAIGKMREIWDQWCGHEGASVDEVALLVDPDSMLYVGGDDPLVAESLARQRHALGLLGAPYAIYSMGDLEAIDWEPFRLVVVPNLFYADDDITKRLRETLGRGGRTVVWTRAAGMLGPEGCDPAGVERLTGVPWGTSRLTIRDMGAFKSVYVPHDHVDRPTLRALTLDAGVHLYADGGEAIYSTERLLASHSGTGGEHPFYLRRKAASVRELFSDRIVARDTDRFVDDLPAIATVLYALED